MSEHKPSQHPPTDDTADADLLEARATVDAFPRDLSELQARCRSLAEAIEAGAADRIATCANQVALGLQTARTTLQRASARRPRAPNAYISLCAADTVVGHLFRRALLCLRGGGAAEVHARVTLHRLASVLEFDIDSAGR